ncbi:MAG: Sua5/YciO/YrdC/YwlC family protein [Candidatus Obscuribacterales bacterium]|nr:Sua5/YciO/YrdC/YwlC family protein [Candidatus Obscuribacterales bacterium]
MSKQKTPGKEIIAGVQLRVRGLVQGVGFRPFVWKAAREFEIKGRVLNDASGVLIDAWGNPENLERFVEKIEHGNLPLARVDSIDRSELAGEMPLAFQIESSVDGNMHTSIAAEAATCADCIEDTLAASNRRFRYAFTNCTHCGPRLSIIKSVPYDRCNTSMAEFELCSACRREYEDPADRRYHAQATACSECGPQLSLRKSASTGTETDSFPKCDAIDLAASLILQGEILAVKGLGGFQLCCDASNHTAVNRLRQRKKRFEKPFALMAKNLEMVRRYCNLSDAESALLSSSSAPIVLLEAMSNHTLSTAIAPAVNTLGFMLPNTPLHHLLLNGVDRPLLVTSGNLSDEPQAISNLLAQEKLGELAGWHRRSHQMPW